MYHKCNYATSTICKDGASMSLIPCRVTGQGRTIVTCTNHLYHSNHKYTMAKVPALGTIEILHTLGWRELTSFFKLEVRFCNLNNPCPLNKACTIACTKNFNQRLSIMKCKLCLHESYSKMWRQTCELLSFQHFSILQTISFPMDYCSLVYTMIVEKRVHLRSRDDETELLELQKPESCHTLT